jgi:putative ABC transport system permease protein
MNIKKISAILKIAYKLLFNDKGKFLALLISITFTVFLIVTMKSLFAGIVHRSSATANKIDTSLCIMDTAVNIPANSIPLSDYMLNIVRSIKVVKYAVRLYSGTALIKLRSEVYQAVTVLGLDDSSLYGRLELIEGQIKGIYAEDAFIVVKYAEYAKLGNPKVGIEFEINDHRGIFVGITKVMTSGLFGMPTDYTT